MTIIIIGGVHHNTLGVIRAIGEKGIDKNKIFLIIIGEKNGNMLVSSKYIKKKNVYYTTPCDIYVKLETIIKQIRVKPVVISCSDIATLQLYTYYDILKDICFLPEVREDIRNCIMNKDVQDEFAIKSGLDIPTSFTTKPNTKFESWDKFPCIIKPISSTIPGGGKSEIQIINNFTELTNAIKGKEYQIQEYIDKEIEFQLIGISLNKGEIVIIPGYTNIIRQPNNTNTGYLKYSPISELNFNLKNIHKFLKTIEYSGLFSIEFIRGGDGKDYFLEINMRNDGNAYVVTRAGVNLPYIWAFYNINGFIPLQEPTTFKEPIYFMPELQDFRNVLNHDIGFISWIKQFYHSKAKAVWSKNDMMPFISMIFHKIFG